MAFLGLFSVDCGRCLVTAVVVVIVRGGDGGIDLRFTATNTAISMMTTTSKPAIGPFFPLLLWSLQGLTPCPLMTWYHRSRN